MAFVAVGLPGLLLALLAHVLLKEPRELRGYPQPAASGDAQFAGTVLALLRKRSYLGIVAGLTLYAFMAYGVMIFFPSYMIRSLGVSLKEVGAGYGAISAASALIGTLGGGWLADRLGRRCVAWYAWLPGIVVLLALPIYAFAFAFSLGFQGFLVCGFVAGTLLSAGVPSIFTAMHAVCGSPRRAVAVAVMLFSMSLVGAGLGPLATGVLSDLYMPAFGIDALRMALITCLTVLLPSGIALIYAGWHMEAEAEA
jgi:MFS family permease